MYKEELKKNIDKIRNIDGVYIWLIIFALPPLINIYLIPLIPISISYTITSLIHGTYNSDVYESIKNNLGNFNYFMYYLFLFFGYFTSLFIDKIDGEFPVKNKYSLIDNIRRYILPVIITTSFIPFLSLLFFAKEFNVFVMSIIDITIYILLFFIIKSRFILLILSFIKLILIFILTNEIASNITTKNTDTVGYLNYDIVQILIVLGGIFIILKMFSKLDYKNLKENKIIKIVFGKTFNLVFIILIYITIIIFLPQLNNEIIKGIKPTNAYLFFTTDNKDKAREIFEKLTVGNMTSSIYEDSKKQYWFEKIKQFDDYGNNGLFIEGVCYLWGDKDYYYFGNFNLKSDSQNHSSRYKLLNERCKYEPGKFRLVTIPRSDDFSVNTYQILGGDDKTGNTSKTNITTNTYFLYDQEDYDDIDNIISRCFFYLNKENSDNSCYFHIGSSSSEKGYKDAINEKYYYDKAYLDILKETFEPENNGRYFNKYQTIKGDRIKELYDNIFNKDTNINLELLINEIEIKNYLEDNVSNIDHETYFKNLKEEILKLESINFSGTDFTHEEYYKKTKIYLKRSSYKIIKKFNSKGDNDVYEGDLCGNFYFKNVGVRLPISFSNEGDGYKAKINREALNDLINFKNRELFESCRY